MSLFAVSGCAGWFYEQPYEQGNVIDEKILTKITPGMPRADVVDILGEPILSVPFLEEDRLDYVYLFKDGEGEKKRKRLQVVFKEGKLADTIEYPEISLESE